MVLVGVASVREVQPTLFVAFVVLIAFDDLPSLPTILEAKPIVMLDKPPDLGMLVDVFSGPCFMVPGQINKIWADGNKSI
jgi:hypothetical protein